MPAPDPADDLRRRHGAVRLRQARPAVRLELTDLTGYFAQTSFRVFQAPYVGAVVMPGGASQTRRELDGWQDWAKARGARGLAYVLIDAVGRGLRLRPGGQAPVGGRARRAGRRGRRRPGRRVFFAAGPPQQTRSLLGAARLEIGHRLGLIDPDAWAFTWVVDAPMFEEDGQGGWTAVHHPFTAPLPEWADKFADEPGGALADAYDLVCNGNEIGGGSIRIHRPAMQQKVFDVIGLSPGGGAGRSSASCSTRCTTGRRRTAASRSAGTACIMLLAGRDTIRDVIAFPKAASGADPLTGAPTPITPEQRREAGIDVIVPPGGETPDPDPRT